MKLKQLLGGGLSRRRFDRGYEMFLIHMEAKKKEKEKPDAWIAVAGELAAKALAHADEDVDGAWQMLKAARREEIPFLVDPELRSREVSLNREADKFATGWRVSAVKDLLALNLSGSSPSERAIRLRDAIEIMDGLSDNYYFKTTIVRNHMRTLLWISFATLAAILGLLGVTGTDPETWPPWDWKTLLLVLLMGVLGSCFSATRAIPAAAASKIPEMASQAWVTLARCVLGATPALAAYAFLKSGMMSGVVANIDLVKILAFSFAAGFSERLVLNVLDAMSPGEKK